MRPIIQLALEKYKRQQIANPSLALKNIFAPLAQQGSIAAGFTGGLLGYQSAQADLQDRRLKLAMELEELDFRDREFQALTDYRSRTLDQGDQRLTLEETAQNDTRNFRQRTLSQGDRRIDNEEQAQTDTRNYRTKSIALDERKLDNTINYQERTLAQGDKRINLEKTAQDDTRNYRKQTIGLDSKRLANTTNYQNSELDLRRQRLAADVKHRSEDNKRHYADKSEQRKVRQEDIERQQQYRKDDKKLAYDNQQKEFQLRKEIANIQTGARSEPTQLQQLQIQEHHQKQQAREKYNSLVLQQRAISRLTKAYKKEDNKFNPMQWFQSPNANDVLEGLPQTSRGALAKRFDGLSGEGFELEAGNYMLELQDQIEGVRSLFGE